MGIVNMRQFFLAIFLVLLTSNLFSTLFASQPMQLYYNDDFFTRYNNTIVQINEQNTSIFNLVNIVELGEKEIEKIKSDYSFYNSLKLSGSWYGFNFKFDENDKLIGVQLSLHESIVLDYKRFMQILALLLDMPYDDLMQYTGLDKAIIVESNSLTKRPKEFRNKLYKEGWVYATLYKQNTIFDITIDKSK
jgi:hypothetical protein